MTREELNFVLNDIACCFTFPHPDTLKCIKVKKDGKYQKYTKGSYGKAILDFNSSKKSEIHFEFLEDVFQKAEDFAFDLLYLD